MNPYELVLSWLLWHQAVEFLKHDIPLMQSADIRFPTVYAGFLRLLGKEAYAREQEAAKELRRAGVTVLGEKTDRGEHLIMWRKGGQTELLRVHLEKLTAEIQKKVDELIHLFAAVQIQEGGKEEKPDQSLVGSD
jgi:hypothetical protein